MADLQIEYAFYKANLDRFAAEYLGRYIVLKDHVVVAVHDDAIGAARAAISEGHELGTFLVQQVTKKIEVLRFRNRRAAGV